MVRATATSAAGSTKETTPDAGEETGGGILRPRFGGPTGKTFERFGYVFGRRWTFGETVFVQSVDGGALEN